MALSLFDETLALLRELEGRSLPYAVVGAVALAFHGVPRATTDIDLLVRLEDLDGVLAVAHAKGFDLAALPMTFRDGMEVRRISKLDGPELLTLDLLLVNPSLLPVFDGRERIETDAGTFQVASREGLIQMKLWASRPQDVADVERLRSLDR